MAGVNKFIGVGNLGRDPETRYMPNGDAVTNISVGISESWKDKNTGEKKEHTEWVRVTFYRKLAEVASQYLKKGSQIYFEGKIQTRKYTDKDGVERYTTEIIADTMQMLGSRQGSSNNDDDATAPRQGSTASDYNNARGGGAARPAPNFSDMDDDIPF